MYIIQIKLTLRNGQRIVLCWFQLSVIWIQICFRYTLCISCHLKHLVEMSCVPSYVSWGPSKIPLVPPSRHTPPVHSRSSSPIPTCSLVYLKRRQLRSESETARTNKDRSGFFMINKLKSYLNYLFCMLIHYIYAKVLNLIDLYG